MTDDDFRSAIPPVRAQAQPWGVIGALLGRRWLTSASIEV